MNAEKATPATPAICPDCGAEIVLDGPVSYGQRVTCPNCETELEVFDTHPVELCWYIEAWDDGADGDR